MVGGRKNTDIKANKFNSPFTSLLFYERGRIFFSYQGNHTCSYRARSEQTLGRYTQNQIIFSPKKIIPKVLTQTFFDDLNKFRYICTIARMKEVI